MRNFYVSCKFCTLTINLSEVVLHVRNVLNASQRPVNKNSLTWWYVLKTSWRCLEDVFARLLEDVLKTSWRRMNKTNILVLIKTSWRRLEDIFWRRMTKTNTSVLIKTSWRRPLKTNTKDVFIKTNVWWEDIKDHNPKWTEIPDNP